MSKNTNAAVAGTAAQTDTPAANVAPRIFDPSKIKIVKQVSTNLLKLRPGMTVYVTIMGPMEKAKALKKQSAEDKAKEPPTLLPCINLETGEVCSIIGGAVLVDLLNDEYPQNAYVKKSFQIVVKEQKDAKGGGGKRYNNYDVKEISV
jgi:hypothetical protein